MITDRFNWKVSRKFIENILGFRLTFVIVTNATYYNRLSSKIAISTNSYYYYKVVFIFSIILLLSLVILTNPVHATNTSIYKSESSKKYSLSSSTINSYAANPHIRNSTTTLKDSVIFLHNLTATKTATTISTIHTSSEVPTLIRGSLSTAFPKSNNGNSFFVKDPSHYFLVDSNRGHSSSESKGPITSAFKNVVHNALEHNDKITKIAFVKPSFTASCI